ncbi:phosphoesterase PA-phosphatase related protein [Crinalium epipsammum PCC 9333]|uniref:Phosphoesterase PA-phosphatase related protein n=1 Tax=Crinalium epipsammum PCC 9333 TaxID=1173022 RepID=K9VV72_9CYAN|nr:phosphatase PAP2 family protein [Crinalium epipsammum]AFZ12008.1 phosphoesterase PA-phosphatase related protein [Crinalium epipsammum PCC 9333]
MPWLKKLLPLFTVIYCTTVSTTVKAETFDRDVSRFVSGTGTVLYLGTGVVLPLLIDGKNGGQHSIRTLDSLGTSVLLCQGLKEVAQVKRPDSEERDSFPSCHATAAFSVATMQSHYHPESALLWYGGASAIALSRVNLNRHRVTEVLAGAALGYFTSRLELSQKRGLILFPLIRTENKTDTVVGLQVVGYF